MSKLNGQSLKAAYMHDNAFLPGLGEIKKELVIGANGNNKVTKLTIDEPFVIVEIFGTATRRNYVFPVPVTNFKILLADEQVVTTPLLRKDDAPNS